MIFSSAIRQIFIFSSLMFFAVFAVQGQNQDKATKDTFSTLDKEDKEKTEEDENLVKRLEKLAKKGDYEAQVDLAVLYLTGQYATKQNPKKAMKLFHEAAEPRDVDGEEKAYVYPKALLYLGHCHYLYYKQANIPQDLNKAYDYYKGAYDLNMTKASVYLAYICHDLNRIDDAAVYYKAGAEYGNQNCAVSYGEFLLYGRGVKADPKKAEEYLQTAAKRGSTKAQILLAECYSGKYEGVDANLSKMIDYLWQAASKEPAAMSRLGYCYQYGIGIEQSFEMAYKWYKKAASFGDAKALIQIGNFYRKGVIVRKSPQEAFKSYLKALELNPDSAMANYKVGLCHANGEGIQKNNELAFRYFMNATSLKSDSGEVGRCMYLVADYYKNGKAYTNDGELMKESPELAFKWYSKAVDEGEPMAFAALGYCYYYGYGTDKDEEKAKLIFTKGAGLNNVASANALKTLFK